MKLTTERAAAKAAALRANVERALRGKPEVVRRAIETLVAGGHLLLEDVPGVGKTTLAQALARSIDAQFRRIQFTSDLLPGDVLGASVPEVHDGRPTGGFAFQPGPIFANVVLADDVTESTEGRVLHVEISSVVGPQGGAWSGAKSVTVEGKLTENGEVIGTFKGNRYSGGGAFGGYKGTCSILGRCAKTLGSDIAKWLAKPTMDARLGNY